MGLLRYRRYAAPLPSLDECVATYDLVEAVERATLDEAVERVAANGNAAFLLAVDNELAS